MKQIAISIFACSFAYSVEAQQLKGVYIGENERNQLIFLLEEDRPDGLDAVGCELISGRSVFSVGVVYTFRADDLFEVLEYSEPGRFNRIVIAESCQF